MLLDHDISGLPVTDESGFLVEVISEFALLSITYDPLSGRQQVRDHMTKHVISVRPDTNLKELPTRLSCTGSADCRLPRTVASWGWSAAASCCEPPSKRAGRSAPRKPWRPES